MADERTEAARLHKVGFVITPKAFMWSTASDRKVKERRSLLAWAFARE